MSAAIESPEPVDPRSGPLDGFLKGMMTEEQFATRCQVSELKEAIASTKRAAGYRQGPAGPVLSSHLLVAEDALRDGLALIEEGAR